MTANVDQIKGKVKKAVGTVTGNQKLKDEGHLDEAVGNIKSFAGKTAAKVKRATDEAACHTGCD